MADLQRDAVGSRMNGGRLRGGINACAARLGRAEIGGSHLQRIGAIVAEAGDRMAPADVVAPLDFGGPNQFHFEPGFTARIGFRSECGGIEEVSVEIE